jgi:DNA primase
MSNGKKPFVDFRAIRARVTMERVLEHYNVLGTMKRSGSRLSGPCPIHNGSNPTQFRVDTEKNLWNCFSECKHGGNVLDFIAKKEDIPILDAALKACEWFGIPLEEVKTKASKDEPELPADKPSEAAAKSAKPPPPPTPAPENTTPNPPLKFRLDKVDRAHPYFAERGITQEGIIDFGLGYFTGDKGIMVGRIAIPIHNVKGEVVAYAGRWPGNPPDGTPKYRLPTGFRKSLELFNLDRAIQEPADKPLVIVEGFFDAVKLHQNGCRKVVALMGSSLSAGQEELIRKHTNGQSQVIVMLDEDDAGRAGRDDIAARLAKFCFVKVHQFDKPGNQPEHLSAEEVAQLFGGVA